VIEFLIVFLKGELGDFLASPFFGGKK